jgi:hypothetical protein
VRIFLCLSLCLFGLFGGMGVAPSAAGDFHQPPKGSALRNSILEAARPFFVQATGGPVEFVVTTLNVLDEWAYGDVKLQRPGGAPIDWSRTRFAEDYAQDMLDTEHNLFLLQEGGDGWTVVEYAVGPTDIIYESWRQQYGIAAELFQN